jgi:hypothetical protein
LNCVHAVCLSDIILPHFLSYIFAVASDPALFLDAHRMPEFFEAEVVALERALAIPAGGSQ